MPYCIICEQKNRLSVARLTTTAQPGVGGDILLELQTILTNYKFNLSGVSLERAVNYDVPWDVCAYCYHDSAAYRVYNWSLLRHI